MVNKIVKQKFIYLLNKATDYANNNGLSYGISAWVGDVFKDADKEPFDKMNTPWHVNNTEFFMKSACFDDEDGLDKLTFFILCVLHNVSDPSLIIRWSKFFQDECNKSASKLVTNLVSNTIKKGRVHKKPSPKQSRSNMSYETETKQETSRDIIVTDIKIFPFKDAGIGHIRALANIILNDAIIIRGLRIMKSDNGLFLSYPVDPFFNGMDYRSLIVPVTREVREYIENEVIKQYHKAVAND